MKASRARWRTGLGGAFCFRVSLVFSSVQLIVDAGTSRISRKGHEGNTLENAYVFKRRENSYKKSWTVIWPTDNTELHYPDLTPRFLRKSLLQLNLNRLAHHG